jgi:membrane-associated two-gene conflict system component 1 (EACC1)
MPTKHRLTLSFEGADVADANRFAAELAERLRDADAPIDVRETRADPSAQDFGATLVLVLASPAVVALAKGVSAWLAMRPNAKITLKGKDGTVIASGLTSADARAVIEQRLSRGG